MRRRRKIRRMSIRWVSSEGWVDTQMSVLQRNVRIAAPRSMGYGRSREDHTGRTRLNEWKDVAKMGEKITRGFFGVYSLGLGWNNLSTR